MEQSLKGMFCTSDPGPCAPACGGDAWSLWRRGDDEEQAGPEGRGDQGDQDSDEDQGERNCTGRSVCGEGARGRGGGGGADG